MVQVFGNGVYSDKNQADDLRSIDQNQSGSIEARTIYVDPQTLGGNYWLTRANNPQAQVDRASFSLNGYGYVGAGRSASANWTSELARYDETLDTWFSMSNKPAATRYSVGMGGGSMLYAYHVGGSSGPASSYRFSDIINTWAIIAYVDTYDGASFNLNGYGYVASLGSSYGSALQQYNEANNAWVSKANQINWATGNISDKKAAFDANGYGYVAAGGDTNRVSYCARYSDALNTWVTRNYTTFSGLANGWTNNGLG
jgi:hypothetical protein